MSIGIPGLPIGLLRSADADAASWAARVSAASGTYSASTLTAVDAFCRSAKNAGYWGKLNRINLFCGDQLAAALVPLKVGGGAPIDTNVAFVAGDYTEGTGLTGNTSTKYLRTGLIPSASLVANSTHLSLYNRSSAGGMNIGVQATFAMLAPFASDAKVYSDQYSVAGGRLITASAIGTPFGFCIGTRTSVSSHVVYRNGVSVASNATADGALPATEVYVFAANNGGVPVISGSACAGYSIGDGLSEADVVAYSAHMETFQDALGRGVN